MVGCAVGWMQVIPSKNKPCAGANKLHRLNTLRYIKQGVLTIHLFISNVAGRRNRKGQQPLEITRVFFTNVQFDG